MGQRNHRQKKIIRRIKIGVVSKRSFEATPSPYYIYIDKSLFEEWDTTASNSPEGDVILSEQSESKDLRTDLTAKVTVSA